VNIKDVKEWVIIADADFDSAKILNESVRKIYNAIVPPRITGLFTLRHFSGEASATARSFHYAPLLRRCSGTFGWHQKNLTYKNYGRYNNFMEDKIHEK
jgi:hypothetical protein